MTLWTSGVGVGERVRAYAQSVFRALAESNSESAREIHSKPTKLRTNVGFRFLSPASDAQ